MNSIATVEPVVFWAGTTLKWKKIIPTNPAPTWSMEYVLTLVDKQIVLTSVAENTDHLIQVAKEDTTDYKEGIYHWISFLTDGTERFQYQSGKIQIKPDLIKLATGYDARSISAQMVQAFEDFFTGKIKRKDFDTLSYSISGRSKSQMSLADLRVEYLEWKAMLKREEDADKLKQGLPTGKKIFTRFV